MPSLKSLEAFGYLSVTLLAASQAVALVVGVAVVVQRRRDATRVGESWITKRYEAIARAELLLAIFYLSPLTCVFHIVDLFKSHCTTDSRNRSCRLQQACRDSLTCCWQC